MIIKRLMTGMLGSNCYIVGDQGEGVIIDPGADSTEIMQAVEKTGLTIKYILLTHAHLDHICSVDRMREKTGAELLVHAEDAKALGSPRHNASLLFGLNTVFGEADRCLQDGEVVHVGGLEFQIIHTPGHTPGGICIRVKDIVFTGDTLFRMSIGRSDLGDGDEGDLKNSIKNKLFTLPEDVTVYPGHGSASTIGYEKKNNPYV